MEALLDAADNLIASESECPSRPNFPIPEEFRHQQLTQKFLELKDCANKGKGWVARAHIPTGSVLMVVKPVAMVMGWQDDTEEQDYDENDENDEEKLNELLHLQLLNGIKKDPSLWTHTLSQMFPRNDLDVASLPAWVCSDDGLFLQVETLIQELGKIKEFSEEVKAISKRLPLVVRYNVLSVETCPELLSHPGSGGYASLSAVGVYHLPSFFNHCSRPNVSRWAVGDVMWFVANRDINQGMEACISYLEHDVLCETPYRRNLLLRMDFNDQEEDEVAGAYDEEGPENPVVDSEVQNELMAMDAFERLSAIEELLQQAYGLKMPNVSKQEEDTSDAMDAGGSGWFKCDIQNLRILKAITLDGLGQTQEALQLWEECVVFTERHLPPLDEASVVMRTQAALCSWHAGESNRAKDHARVALRTHSMIFGGGVARFRRRYQRDLRLSLRPEKGNEAGPDSVDLLWPLNG